MICVCLQGGLGNQLFQYAAGRALSLRHGTDLLIDTRKLGKRKRGVTLRHFELNCFQHVAKIATDHEMRLFSWLERVPIFSHLVSPWHMYLEKKFGFNGEFNFLPDQTRLVGYWQSFRYFSDISIQIFRELEPVDQLSHFNMLFLDQIGAVNSVGVHVRRGDYCSLSTAAAFHGVQPITYYKEAFVKIRERVDSPRFFIFSDDIEWCRKNIPIGKNTTFVAENVRSDAWQDMVLMSHCKHHIIANSSFSWWGAWIADQRFLSDQRIVVAPARWFAGHAEQNLLDRLPPHWLIQ